MSGCYGRKTWNMLGATLKNYINTLSKTVADERGGGD